MFRRKYKFKKLNKMPKSPQKDIDLNVYTYNEKRDRNGRLEWASVGVIETALPIEGIQLTSES